MLFNVVKTFSCLYCLYFEDNVYKSSWEEKNNQLPTIVTLFVAIMFTVNNTKWMHKPSHADGRIIELYYWHMVWEVACVYDVENLRWVVSIKTDVCLLKHCIIGDVGWV